MPLTGDVDSAPAAAIIAVLACSICGNEVGYEELYPPGVPRSPERGVEHPRRKLDRQWHCVSNGDYFGDGELTPDQFDQSAAALSGEHPGSFLALYCAGCQAVYCYNHSRVKYSEDPPRVMGSCIKGHLRVIDW